MPKAVFAVTNVKFSSEPGDFFPAGTQIDTARFANNKEIFSQLHDAGAIEIRIVEEPKTEAEETTTVGSEEPVVEDSNTEDDDSAEDAPAQ